MKKIIYLLTVLILAMPGCYEDKGNYDYKDIKELIIDFPNFENNINIGDLLVIDPKFSIDIPEDAPYISYRWSINGNTREGWDKRKFEWIADTVMTYTDFSLQVTDNRTGLVFAACERLAVNSIFDAEGWIVLSEIDGKSVISFVKHKKTDKITDYVTEVEVFKDAYGTTNNGEVLGTNPIDFQERFCNEWGTVGQFVIFQDDPVEIDGLSFAKVLNLSQIFVGGALPAKIVGGSFMSILDVLQDDKGQLYTRIKSTEDLFHSEYFLPKPIKYKNEVLTDCKVIRGRYGDSQATLIHDRKYQRFLYLFDGEIDYRDPLKYAGEIKPIPGGPQFGTTPEKYFPLDNTSTYDIINITYTVSDWDCVYKMLIREKSSGTYYCQSFKINKDYGKITFTIGDMEVYEIKGLNFEPDAVCFQTYDNHNKYIFFAKDDKLYIYDPDYPNTPVSLYLDFGKDYSTKVKITSINGDVRDNERMGLGLDNGDFCIIRVEGAKNLSTDKEKIEIRLDPKDYLGKIIKVYTKIGDINGWN